MKTKEELLQMYDTIDIPRIIIIVSKDGKWFHVDEDGVPLYEERFDDVDTFDEYGHAYVSLDGRRFRINMNGEDVEEDCLDAEYANEEQERYNAWERESESMY